MTSFSLKTALGTALASAALVASSPALAEQPIKIGGIYLMSGSAATYGEFAKQGATLAIDEVNADGGVLGRPLELHLEDGQGKVAVAIQAARKLVYQDKVDLLMGIDSSGVAEGLVPVVPELGKPFMITHAATPAATGRLCNKYTFRDGTYVAQQMAGAAAVAADTDAAKWTTIGPDYAFGHQTWEYFSKYLKERNPDVQIMDDAAAFPKFGAEDFTPFISSVMAAKPEGIMISLWGGDLVNFVRQASKLGFFEQSFTNIYAVGAATEVLTALGEQMPEGQWLATRYWYDAWDTPMNKKFVADYKKAWGHPPSYNAEQAYMAIYAFKAAIEKAGSVDADKVIAALKGLTIPAPFGDMHFREGDNQALIGPTIGLTGPMHESDGIRTLVQIRNFNGADVTPPVDPACKM